MIKLNSGFTLVEVLVSLAIIALISAIAIPNLRKYSSEEQIKNTTGEVVNILKTAQSSALTRIKCTSSESSSAWKVKLAREDYSLVAECETSGEKPPVKSSKYSAQGAPGSSVTIVSSSNKCLTAQIDIIFRTSLITYKCSGDSSESALTSNVTITLADKNNASVNKTITIDKGGIIYGN